MQRILLHLSKVILLAATLFMLSCGNTQIIESGITSNKTSEVVDVTADFDKIRVSQNIEVELSQGANKSFEIIASDEARQNLEIEVEEGELSIVVGTGAFLVTSCDKVPDNLTNDVICNASSVSGKYIIESNVLTCCSAFNWFCKN